MQVKQTVRIRWLFLALSMLILILTLNPILVRADANGTHVDADGRLVVKGSSGSTSKYDGGGAAKTGWLVYLVSAEHASKGNEGNTISAVIKSDVVYVDCQSSLPAGAYTSYLTPKISQDQMSAMHTNRPRPKRQQ